MGTILLTNMEARKLIKLLDKRIEFSQEHGEDITLYEYIKRVILSTPKLSSGVVIKDHLYVIEFILSVMNTWGD